MNKDKLLKADRTALALMAAALILAAVLMSLPLYHFSAVVYSKKSANTVVGDEKYQELRRELESEAQAYEERGLRVSIDESVTERTNSKGETSSLVAVSLKQSFDKNIWSFLKGNMSSCTVLKLMLALAAAGLILTLAGSLGSMGRTQREMTGKEKLIRGLPVFLFGLDCILTPVFILMNNQIFWRKLSLYNEDLLTEGKDSFYAGLDRLLFDSQMGEGIGDAVKKLSADHSALVWLLLLCFAAAFLAAVQLRFGAVKKTFLRVLLYLFVIAVCVVTLFPYYVMLITAFRSNAETLDMYFLHMLPTKWIWSNLKDIIDRGVLRYLGNSFMIAGGATALAMLCGIPAAFAMARMRFAGKKFFLGFVIMSQMFSPVVLLIGISQLMNILHLNDTIPGLVMINAAFNQAFAIWLLRGTFVAISPEMEQAAKIDGCTTMGSLTKVLIPMAAPGIVTALIFVFINAWNEYTISTVLISTASKRPITVGITQFSSFNMIEWQYLFAASLLATIPVVILFMMIEKYLTAGLTSGGVKG